MKISCYFKLPFRRVHRRWHSLSSKRNNRTDCPWMRNSRQHGGIHSRRISKCTTKKRAGRRGRRDVKRAAYENIFFIHRASTIEQELAMKVKKVKK